MRQIVWTERNSYAVTQNNANAVFAHTTTKLGSNFRAIVSADLKLTTCENLSDFAVQFNMVVSEAVILLFAIKS